MLSRYERAMAIMVAIGVSLIVSACGGSSSTTSSLTKAQFIAQADRICEQTNEAQLAAVVSANKKGTGGDLSPAEKQKLMVTAGMVPVKEEARQISELGAPEGDEETVDEIAEGIEDGAGKVEAEGTVDSVGTAFSSVNKIAAGYGLKSCAQSP
jgi:hypothetical protein